MKKIRLFLRIITIICSYLHIITTCSTDTYHRYIWANYNQFAGNLPPAKQYYEEIFSSKGSVYVYKGYLNLLADTRQWKQIAHLIPSLEQTFAHDPDIQLLFVHALEKTKQTDKADNLVIKLSQTFKTHSEIALRAAQTYARRREPENALITINAYLNSTPGRPNNFIFYFLQANIYIQLTQYDNALKSIKQCLDMHPQFDKGWLLCASLHEKEGNIQQALAGYTTFLELSGGNNQVEQHLFQLMLKYKSLEDTQHITLPHTATLENALALFKKQQYPQALALVDRCIQQNPTNDECKLLKIQILSTMKNFTQAASTLETWILSNPHTNIWPKTLNLLSFNGMPRANIIETFLHILNKQPDNLWCTMYCADMYLRTGQSTHAITHLEKAITLITDTALKGKTLYQLALLQHEHNNHEKMLHYLEQAYALNTDCPHINNTLAYYWATKGKDLIKARSFITKSLAADNTNPYFLDTHALILYKEKKYEQSQAILEQLAYHNNGTMLLHLAKVHYALNNKENADTFTKKAESFVKNDHEKKALTKMQLLLAQT